MTPIRRSAIRDPDPVTPIRTVKDHVAAVLKALGVASRTQAVVVATQRVQRGA